MCGPVPSLPAPRRLDVQLRPRQRRCEPRRRPAAAAHPRRGELGAERAGEASRMAPAMLVRNNEGRRARSPWRRGTCVGAGSGVLERCRLSAVLVDTAREEEVSLRVMRLEEALWRGVSLAKPAAQLGDGRLVMKFAFPGASGSVAVDELGTVEVGERDGAGGAVGGGKQC